jgi:HEAT repeat protein
VQLEAPLDEVDLESAPALAEEKDGSGWIDSGDPASIPLLIRYLRTHDELAQLGALAEFAGMGAKAKKAVPAIVLALQDPKSTIRVAAAVTLIQMNIQTKTAIKALAKELRSADAKLREPAAGAVDQLVNPPPEMNFSCWGPDPPPLIARPWVRKAIQQALNH